MHYKYTVFVNTCDAFEDCWEPFFKLFKINWPEYDGKILLNTESKEWVANGVNLQCTKVSVNEKRRLTWSECLLRGLERVDTPLVLYFQEDYFLDRRVKANLVDNSVAYMLDHPEVKHIALTRHGSYGPYESHMSNWLMRIPQNAKYRISTQAGLWRVEALKSYLRAEENGWMFEIYGTWRAQQVDEEFLMVDFSKDGGAIEYIHTGIIKGKWHPDIPQVFEFNDIHIEFDERGIYRVKPRFIQRVEVLSKILNNPSYFFAQFTRWIIWRLKFRGC